MMVPVIIWLVLTHRMQAAFWLFALAGLSDILDGLLARILKESTKIGAYLDPLADKALLMGLFVTLSIRDYLPLWLVILVVFRDVMIIIGSLLLLILDKGFTVNPLLISKLNTLAQILLISSVLGTLALQYPYPHFLIDFLTKSAALTTICSGIGYIYVWIKTVNRVQP